MAKAINGKAEGDCWSRELIPVLLIKERSLDAVQKQDGKLEGPAESCLTQASVFQAASVRLTPAHLCGEGGAGPGGGNLWLGPRTGNARAEAQGGGPTESHSFRLRVELQVRGALATDPALM